MDAPSSDDSAAEPSFEDAVAELALAGASLTTDPADDGEAPAGVAPGVSASLGQTGPDCGLAETIRASLQADAELTAALAKVPRPARSVANAVMLWDGEWVRVSDAAPDVLDAVRAALSLRVEAAPESCRAQVMAGPAFIPIELPDGAIVLTVGSGIWRWGQLVDHHVR